MSKVHGRVPKESGLLLFFFLKLTDEFSMGPTSVGFVSTPVFFFKRTGDVRLSLLDRANTQQGARMRAMAETKDRYGGVSDESVNGEVGRELVTEG